LAPALTTFETCLLGNHNCRGIWRRSPEGECSSYLSNLVCYSAFRDRRETSLTSVSFGSRRPPPPSGSAESIQVHFGVNRFLTKSLPDAGSAFRRRGGSPTRANGHYGEVLGGRKRNRGWRGGSGGSRLAFPCSPALAADPPRPAKGAFAANVERR